MASTSLMDLASERDPADIIAELTAENRALHAVVKAHDPGFDLHTDETRSRFVQRHDGTVEYQDDSLTLPRAVNAAIGGTLDEIRERYEADWEHAAVRASDRLAKAKAKGSLVSRKEQAQIKPVAPDPRVAVAEALAAGEARAAALAATAGLQAPQADDAGDPAQAPQTDDGGEAAPQTGE